MQKTSDKQVIILLWKNENCNEKNDENAKKKENNSQFSIKVSGIYIHYLFGMKSLILREAYIASNNGCILWDKQPHIKNAFGQRHYASITL